MDTESPSWYVNLPLGHLLYAKLPIANLTNVTATLPRSSPGMERSCRSYSLHSRSAITHAPPQVLHNFDRDERHAFPERVYRVHQVAATQQISLCYTIALAILVAACLVATALGVALYLAKGHKRAGMVVYFIGGLATTVAMGGLMASARRSVAEIMTMAILVWTVFPTNFKELVF